MRLISERVGLMFLAAWRSSDDYRYCFREERHSMPEMVRMPSQNRERAVKLLQQQYARELVR